MASESDQTFMVENNVVSNYNISSLYSISSEADLFEVKSDWNSDNFTWITFGICSLSDIEAIKLLLFLTNPITRGKIHDIWKLQQHAPAIAPGY